MSSVSPITSIREARTNDLSQPSRPVNRFYLPRLFHFLRVRLQNRCFDRDSYFRPIAKLLKQHRKHCKLRPCEDSGQDPNPKFMSIDFVNEQDSRVEVTRFRDNYSLNLRLEYFVILVIDLFQTRRHFGLALPPLG